MRVEVDSSEAHGLSMPRRFRLDGRGVKGVKVLDQWFGTDYRYYKSTGSDRALYILLFDENRTEGTLPMDASPKARTDRPRRRVGPHILGWHQPRVVAHDCSVTSAVRICRRSALCARLLLRSACAAGE